MDLNHVKGRLAEALVESIFRQAGYQVSRLGRESHVQRLVKVGADEFLPDFLVWKPVEGSVAAGPVYRLLTIEAKYRANLHEFLRRDGDALFSSLQEHWPELYFIFVTDNPGNGRSCFQVVNLKAHVPGTEPTTVDLQQVRELDIYRKTIEEHEDVVRRIFPLLNSPVLAVR